MSDHQLLSLKKILVLAAHPDDETIGCAGLIHHVMRAGGKTTIGMVTHGEAADDSSRMLYGAAGAEERYQLGELRRQESISSGEILGVPAKNFSFLGYPNDALWELFSNSESMDSETHRNPWPWCAGHGHPSTGSGLFHTVSNLRVRVGLRIENARMVPGKAWKESRKLGKGGGGICLRGIFFLAQGLSFTLRGCDRIQC